MDTEVTNVGEFNKGLDDFLKEVETDAHRQIRKIVYAVWGGVTVASPVDTGMFRANWMVGVNKINVNTVASISRNSYPNPDFKVGDTIYISNALPYAHRLESGWSPQAPQGVAAPTVRAIEAKIRQGAFE